MRRDGHKYAIDGTAAVGDYGTRPNFTGYQGQRYKLPERRGREIADKKCGGRLFWSV